MFLSPLTAQNAVSCSDVIHIGGPALAQSLTEAGFIDEYRLYLRPVVLGGGRPFFAGPRPPLHLVASDLIVDGLIRLTYVPA
ncbi:MAG TPA: dihydrofolate reductase family protein [Candidatus Acidoferrum sp.]